MIIPLNIEDKDVANVVAAHEVKDIEQFKEWLRYEIERKTEVYLKKQQQLTLPPIIKPVITFDNSKVDPIVE